MRTEIVASVGGGVILTVLQGLTGMAFGPLDVEVPPGILPWMLPSNMLLAGVLAWLARRSVWTGWRLAAALFAISYGIGQANSFIEAYFFALLPRPGLLQEIFLRSLPPALLFPPVMVLLTGRWSRAGAASAILPERSAMGWMGRFAACSVAYVLLYFAAGMIIFPYVQGFYEQLRLPSPITIILLELFVRGPVFAAIGFLIVRMAPAMRVEHALMVGVAMSVLGGVVPLIVPNPFIPDHIRWVHFGEVVSSNLVFGCMVGWLLGGSSRPRHADMVSTAA